MVSESYPCTGSVGSSSSLSLCEVDTEPKVVTEILCLRVRVGVRVTVGVGVKVWVRVNYFRDSFSVLLRAQHYSMLTTFGSVSTAFIVCSKQCWTP